MSNTPPGLSPAGKRMHEFLHDRAEADGNNIMLPRRELMEEYRKNLADPEIHPYQKAMEIHHGFIQWFFPLPTPGVNPLAPVLSMKDYELLQQDPQVQPKIKEHFDLMTKFMGIARDEKGDFVKADAAQWNSWIDNAHNYRRISRILESMTNFGLKDEAEKFYAFLVQEAKRESVEVIAGKSFKPFTPKAIDSCARHWNRSVLGTEGKGGAQR